ncbi:MULTISPECIES: VWA domain-containing protein [Prauserella salsuginis group]|uniref:VWA domain-containing protein n=1 Tax=Prauserella salsuginis TaxID=387889 RepID=A0ABW6G4G2_9PSEU|nr:MULTISPECIES: VWA domain-containing protein [Prauserella salsuginis group]MCR3718154.1 hypothetical protein [Prauserella flava]MCR3732724.1 hypothetical protein [Prauserella salsuginis]
MTAHAVAGRLVEFAHALREHGIAVGTGETVDAAAAAEAVGLADRERLREALAASVLRGAAQRPVFDGVFDLYFPTAHGTSETTVDEPATPAQLRDQLLDALVAGDDARVRALAATGIDLFGGYGAASGGQGGQGTQGTTGEAGGNGGSAARLSGWSAYQTLSEVRPQALRARLRDAIREARTDGLDGEPADALADREAAAGIAAFTDHVRAEARRRTAELRGRDRIARHAVAPQTDLVSFTSATAEQFAEMRRAVQPLSRKLATRLAARRRRATRGRIDLRRTVRRSLATGGVPMRPVMRRRRPGRPELVLLCDMSGSVAGFAQFTLLLTQALSDQFSKVRSFAFVSRTDEITELVRAGRDEPENLADRIVAEADLTQVGMSSDYDGALQTFADGWGDVLGPRTSVLILGDGRTNGAPPNLPALRAMAERARHVYWLNPERESSWGTGDSEAHRYAREVPMFECRTIRQLSRLVTRLLPD